MLTVMNLRETIRKNLRLVTDHVADCVGQDMTDVNRYAEDFYCGLLNVAFGYQLRNLNREQKNYAAIDLADEENKIAVQVTSTVSRAKVTKTLKKFFDGRMDETFHRLILLVIGKEDEFRDPFRAERDFNFDPERDIWDTPRLLDKLEHIENIATLRAVAEYLQEQVDAPQMRRPILHLPMPERRNPAGFLGREKERDWINGEMKERTKPVVVAGLGGVGKTALAVQFAKKCWKGQVYFATFKDTFTRTLADSVGQAIPAEERKGMDEKQTAELALSYLRRCEPGDLLIVDNAEVAGKSWAQLTDDPFYEKLRRLSMAVLMTTRHRDTGGIWLGRLAQDDLREIFHRHGVSISNGDMDALIEAVDGHTMTVDLMARTMDESWETVTAEMILEAMANSSLPEADYPEVYTDHDQDPQQRQIYAHLRSLFNLTNIPEEGKQALRCATLLPTGGMDPAIFLKALPEGPAKAIRLLEKQGWVQRADHLLTIHPVVRLVCRTELKPTRENCHAFVMGVWGWYDDKKYDKDRFRQLAELFAAADAVLEDPFGWYIGQAGFLWDQLGDSRQALKCILQTVKMLEQRQPNSKGLATAYNNVGSTYGDLGDHENALKYELRALEIGKKVLQPEDLELATFYNNVGYTYGFLGEHSKALECHLKAFSIRSETLPELDPAMGLSYNNLGYIYFALQDYDKALEYLEKGLLIRREVLAEAHPDIANSLYNIACVYIAQDEYIKARECIQRVVEIAEKSLPEEHHFYTMYHGIAELLEHKIEQKQVNMSGSVRQPEECNYVPSF